MFKHLKILLIVGLCALVFCGCSATPKRYSAVYPDVFDTLTEFTAYCSSQEEFDKISGAVHAELFRLHEIFDIYSDYGFPNAKVLNDSAGSPVEVHDEVIELIADAKTWHEKTSGKLNIALGSVLSVWHDCREREVLPDRETLNYLAEHCDIENILVDGNYVTLLDPEMSLDFGALAKGYAAEKAAEAAISAGAESFALSVGGNVVTYGKMPSGKWEIGIENPDGGLLTTVKVAGECVVTSGDYQRYFEVDGVRYHHIIDPDTLYPAAHWRSVTVIAKSSAEADALSTALFCMDYEAGAKLAKEYGAEVMWVAADGEITRSEGFKDYER